MDMEYKNVPVDLKAIDEKGEGVLRFIRFHQEDKDSDITLPGFVGQQDSVLLSGHNWKSDFPPLGYGSSFEADGATNFRFQLNMADERAKAWHSWLKMGHNLQQVSYGFSPYADGQERGQKDGKPVRFLKPRADGSPGAKLHEVSFVVVGSGNDTAVLHVKQADEQLEKESRSMEAEQPIIELPAGRWAVGVHHTETDLKAWDTSIQLHRIHRTGAPGYFRQIFAAQNPHADLTVKQHFAFPHHQIGPDGEPGPASVRACAEGLQVLEGWWVGMLPDEDVKAIYAHLAAHLKDAQREPPELRGMGDARYPLDDQIELALWKLEAVLHQIDHVRDMRSRKGMTLTEARLGQIEKMNQYFATLCALVKMKQLDRPADAVLEELSAEARADALARRLEATRTKVAQDTKAREAAAIAERVQRWEARIRA